jgi:hypothetical protein
MARANTPAGSRDDRQFKTASAVLDDERRLIAALKLQRWDVVKWAVTVNIALAAVAATIKTALVSGLLLFSLAVLVAVIGETLMLYYNHRLTNTRDDALKTKKHLENFGVDFAFTGTPAKEKDSGYDWQELVIFSVILTLSPVIVLFVSFVASGHP